MRDTKGNLIGAGAAYAASDAQLEESRGLPEVEQDATRRRSIIERTRGRLIRMGFLLHTRLAECPEGMAGARLRGYGWNVG